MKMREKIKLTSFFFFFSLLFYTFFTTSYFPRLVLKPTRSQETRKPSSPCMDICGPRSCPFMEPRLWLLGKEHSTSTVKIQANNLSQSNRVTT